MKNKLKYISRSFDQFDLEDDFEIVDNPTKWNNLPDGEYLIRGDKKDHSIEYYVKDNIWYLVDNKTKDNGHYMCAASTYQLYPNLSEKEWAILSHPLVWNKLNKYWQRAVYGYKFSMELRNMTRDIKKSMLKY